MKPSQLFFAAFASLILLGGCRSEKGGHAAGQPAGDSIVTDPSTISMKQIEAGGKTYNVADIDDSMRVYRKEVKRQNCFIVISKQEFRLYVYEARPAEGDTVLAAQFPVCYARNAEAKTASGDMCTPECGMDAPFTISQIQDASGWHHDFGDGRGSIRAYGDWFIRLVTPGFTGVGIHGSTNNEASVPGRDSEGCIRLRDGDLHQLHDLFAVEGQKVVIKAATQGKLPFELKAQQRLGSDYLAPRRGYRLPAPQAVEEEAPAAAPSQSGPGPSLGPRP